MAAHALSCLSYHSVFQSHVRVVRSPILSKLLSFSDADEEVVRDSFGEKETYTFRLW